MPAFSVVVINYNGKQFLEQTLSHIQESEISPEKVVIVDDASTDNSVQMVSEQFPEYTLIQHTENRGPTAARNTGAKEARGKYIVFMDNDVLIELDTFEELITFMEKDESRGVCSPVLINSQGSREWWNMGYDFGTIRFFIAGIFHKLW